VTALRKLVAFVWKVLAGGIFCQFPLTAMVVVGWTYRAMQRAAVRAWSRASALDSSELDALYAQETVFLRHQTWPNWLLEQRSLRGGGRSTGVRGKSSGVAWTLGGSAWANLRVGFAGIANTTVAMALPAVLWQVGWYAGWDNSFNKGYEQYYSGIALSWIGIVLFLALMLYVPMAQARQAVTGDWRSFYNVRTVWRVATANPLRMLLLAAVFSLVALPINVLLIAPQGFEKSNPDTANLTDVQFLAYLNRYYFFVSLVGFAGYVLVRIVAARWYAAGLLSALKKGRIAVSDLRGDEAAALHTLQLDRPAEAPQRHPVVAATLAVSKPVWRGGWITAALLVWFTFVAQIYVREFVNYHPYRGFMNQPLVQLPWLRFVPAELQSSVRAVERAEK